jgi:hypothetical protein
MHFLALLKQAIGVSMAETQKSSASAKAPKESQLSPDIIRLLDIFAQIERRRQARLRSLPKKEA